MRAVVPIANLQRRIPEVGRIRTGIQSTGTSRAGKKYTAPKAIDTFRFTSQNEDIIGQVADLYGGTPGPWQSPSGPQFEVVTEANEIRIVLPPDPLGGTPIYELWGGGGCDRRCDGLTCQTVAKGPDGPEYTDVPCICSAKGEMACSPHTRLSVILPEVQFGMWRYESAKSWNVAQELPGMIDLVSSLQTRGLTHALLALEHRRSTAAGETRKFTIPVIRVPHSFDQLAAGDARVGSLGDGTSAAPALAAGEAAIPSPVEPAPDPVPSPAADSDIVDAELVDDDALDIEGLYEAARMSPTRALKHARLVAEKKGLPLPLGLEEVDGDLARYVANDLAKAPA